MRISHSIFFDQCEFSDLVFYYHEFFAAHSTYSDLESLCVYCWGTLSFIDFYYSFCHPQFSSSYKAAFITTSISYTRALPFIVDRP